MKIGKIFLLMAMLIVMSFVVSASSTIYDANSTITIDAIYTENGILTNASANITIYLPDGNMDIQNIGMNSTGLGLFSYDYSIPTNLGQYKVVVRFYNESTFLGLDSGIFNVGNGYAFILGNAPVTPTQLNTMWIVLGVLIVLAITGMVMQISLLTLFCGIILLIMCVVTFPFSTIVGVMNLMIGVIFLLAGGFNKA